jgi:FdhE protein
MTTQFITPEEIAARSRVEPPYLHLPVRDTVFADRAVRLRSLAAGHAMAPYLEFVALVADAQHAELATRPAPPLPDAAALSRAHEHGMPPLAVASLHRDAGWRTSFRRIVAAVAARCAPTQAAVLAAIETLDDASLEVQADKLLGGTPFELDRAAAPLIGAALQVCWVDLVTRLPADSFVRLDVPGVCPCCGSRPVASIVRLAAEVSGYRYVACSLCAAQWHLVRVKCAHCDSTAGIHYQGIDGTPQVVKAECCDECGSYLKIMTMEKDPQVDPVADDLAAVALDLLMADTDKTACGVNLMLIHGDAAE